MRAFLIQHINTAWLAMVVIVAVLSLAFPEVINRNSIAGLLDGLGALALIVYLLLSLSRALLMIPSTPFVLAGGLSFPEWPLLVIAISCLGIVAGALLVYSFPSLGSYDRYLEGKYPDRMLVLREQLHGPRAFWIVAGWAFFPLVPTDLICYVAGVVKMSRRKMVTALVIGEIPLVTLYVYAGVEFGEWLRI